jgi:hypothetical protein
VNVITNIVTSDQVHPGFFRMNPAFKNSLLITVHESRILLYI